MRSAAQTTARPERPVPRSAGSWCRRERRAHAPAASRDGPWSRRSSCLAAGEQLVELGQLLTQPAAHELAQFEDGVVGDRAADAVAVPLTGHDAGLREHADVLGDVLLTGAERLGELVDGQRPVAER